MGSATPKDQTSKFFYCFIFFLFDLVEVAEPPPMGYEGGSATPNDQTLNPFSLFLFLSLAGLVGVAKSPP